MSDGTVGIARIAISRLVRTDLRREGKAALKRDDSIELPSADQPVSKSAEVVGQRLAFAEGQIVGARNAGRIGDVVGGGSPIALQIVGVHHHLRLVVGLRAGKRRIDIQILRPGVVGAKLSPLLKRWITSTCSAL